MASEPSSTSTETNGVSQKPTENAVAGPSTSNGAPKFITEEHEDDWQTASSPGFRYASVRGASNCKGKKRRQKGVHNLGTSSHLQDEDDSPQAKQQRMGKRLGIVSERRKLLAHESFQRAFRDSLAQASLGTPSGIETGKERASWPSSPPQRILCLGLGSVKDNRVAQIQLALLLELRAAVQRHHGRDAGCVVEAYDPIWNDEDETLLKALEIEMASNDKAGAYLLEEPTLVYMPHCDRVLYEALLRCNWTPEGLRRLTLCANDLSRYSDLDPRLAQNAPAVARVIPHLVSVALPPLSSPNNDAFNDLLLQAVRFPERQDQEVVEETLPSSTTPEDDLVSQLAGVRIAPQQGQEGEKDQKRKGRGARRAKAQVAEVELPSLEAFWALPS